MSIDLVTFVAGYLKSSLFGYLSKTKFSLDYTQNEHTIKVVE